MGDEFDDKFKMAKQNVKEGSEQWWALKYKYDMMRIGAAKENAFCHSLVKNMIKQSRDIRSIQVSTFNRMKSRDIIRIAAAMSVLHDILKHHNLLFDTGEGVTKTK